MSDTELNSSKTQIQQTLDLAFSRQLREGHTLTWSIRDVEHLKSIQHDPFVTWLHALFIEKLSYLSMAGADRDSAQIVVSLHDGALVARFEMKLVGVGF